MSGRHHHWYPQLTAGHCGFTEHTAGLGHQCGDPDEIRHPLPGGVARDQYVSRLEGPILGRVTDDSGSAPNDLGRSGLGQQDLAPLHRYYSPPVLRRRSHRHAWALVPVDEEGGFRNREPLVVQTSLSGDDADLGQPAVGVIGQLIDGQLVEVLRIIQVSPPDGSLSQLPQGDAHLVEYSTQIRPRPLPSSEEYGGGRHGGPELIPGCSGGAVGQRRSAVDHVADFLDQDSALGFPGHQSNRRVSTVGACPQPVDGG